jgi:signal transduction histidine kinase
MSEQRRWYGPRGGPRGRASERSRDELDEEQGALRRIATLVARGAPSVEVFAAVAEETGRLLRADITHMVRYEPGGEGTVVAAWSAKAGGMPVGHRFSLEGRNISSAVKSTGRPARIDDSAQTTGPVVERLRELGVRSSVGTPIVVDEHLWGVMIVSSTRPAPMAEDTAARIADFTDLAATAVSNTEARSELRRLADEQASLRRVATLVARGTMPEQVFSAVVEEMGRLLDTGAVHMIRYGNDATSTVVAGWSQEGDHIAVGDHRPLTGRSVSALVLRTGRPARLDDYSSASGPIASVARESGLHSSVGAPIVVDNRVWGAIIASSRRPEPLPLDAEARITEFTDLVATAISNAQARTELAASRARIVAAADETRRRIERDLHDGTQQRLVTLGLELRAAEAEVPPDHRELEEAMSHAAEGLSEVLDDLREISRGIHPAILSEGGLAPAMKALARRSAIPVELDTHLDARLPESAEVTAYFVASEALANAAKHSGASLARIEVRVEDAALHLVITDDGLGGADPARGSGLIGLTDRVETLGGTLTVVSPAGEGTTMRVELPIRDG